MYERWEDVQIWIDGSSTLGLLIWKGVRAISLDRGADRIISISQSCFFGLALPFSTMAFHPFTNTLFYTRFFTFFPVLFFF